MQKKRPNRHPAPSSDSNDSSSCGEEAVEGPSMGKGGGKKPKVWNKLLLLTPCDMMNELLL